MSQSKAGATLGVRLRGASARRFGRPSHGNAYLYYVYSPRAKMDFEIFGELRYAHFLWAESQSDIIGIDYRPHEWVVPFAQDSFKACVDAIETHRDGSTVWRELRASSDLKNENGARYHHQEEAKRQHAAANGIIYERTTGKELSANLLLLTNWRDAIAYMAAAQFHSLHDYRARIHGMSLTCESFTPRDIQSMSEISTFPLMMAAAFHAVQDGLLDCDLDRTVLSYKTRFNGRRS